jgi:hypothetical protein
MNNHRYVLVFGFKKVLKKALMIYLALSLGVIPVLPSDSADIIPPGNWGAVESLTQGTEISVRMTSGDKMDGKYLGLDAEGIRLTMDNQERIFPRSAVTHVWQLRVKDKKLNGALIGMGLGAVAGGAIGAAAKAGFSGEDALGGAFVLAGIGLGAIIGVTVDALIKGNKLIYRAR